MLKHESTQTKAKRNTSKKQADKQDKQTVLLRHIQTWRQAQLVYTPYAATLLSENVILDDDGQPRPETASTTPLFLPSSFPAVIRAQSNMKPICEMERRLREAQADDALAEIRRQQRVIQGLWQFKKINVSGTGNRPNTRMLTLYNRINVKIMRCADCYCRARTALVTLDPEGQWQERLKVLRNEDIRGPGKEPDDRSSNSRFEPSWIWLVSRVISSGETEDEFNESMRVEWAKARARMMRWGEEYQILQEEMRRVLVYMEWKASWWEQQATLRKDASPEILHGVAAYAHKQAYIARRMAGCCAAAWLPECVKLGLSPSWATDWTEMETESEKAMSLTPTACEEEREVILAQEENIEFEEDHSDDDDNTEDIDDGFEFDD